MASNDPCRCQFSTMDKSDIGLSSAVGEESMVERIEYSRLTASDPKP